MAIWIATADQIAGLLVTDIDPVTVVVFGRKLFQLLGNQVSNAPEFFVAEGVRGLRLEDQLSP